jgi:hypothetical protein
MAGLPDGNRRLSAMKSKLGMRELDALVAGRTAESDLRESKQRRPLVISTNYNALIGRALQIRPPLEGWAAYEKKLKSQKRIWIGKRFKAELSVGPEIKKTGTRDNELEIGWLRAGLEGPNKNIKDLARLLKVHRTIVYKMLWGTRRIKFDELAIIAAYIGRPGAIDIFKHSDNGYDVTIKVVTRPQKNKR